MLRHMFGRGHSRNRNSSLGKGKEREEGGRHRSIGGVRGFSSAARVPSLKSLISMPNRGQLKRGKTCVEGESEGYERPPLYCRGKGSTRT